MFTRQHREWWRAHVTLVLIQARLAAGYPPSRLRREARLTALLLGELASDETPQAELAALRDVAIRLEKAQGGPATVPHRERLLAEADVRARTVRSAAAPARAAADVNPGALAALGRQRLVELIVVDGDIHVLVCGDGTTVAAWSFIALGG